MELISQKLLMNHEQMKEKSILLLPTNITPRNVDWKRINFLSALCCYDNSINAEQRRRIPIVTKKLSATELEIAFSKITQTYQILLPKIASILNTMHGMRGSVRFWEIQLNVSFLYFIATAYEIRFRLLQAAKIFYGQEWCVAIPKDMHLKLDSQKLFLDRIAYISTAEDWLFYAEVAIAENLPTLCTDIDHETLNDRKKQMELVDGVKLRTKIKKTILSTLNSGFIFINRVRNLYPQTLDNEISVHENNYLFSSLLSCSKIKLNIIPDKDPDFTGLTRDARLRSKFGAIITESSFERTIISLLPKYMPISLVEGFSLTKRLAEPYVAGGLHVLPISSAGMIISKHAVATGVDRLGARTFYFQHGGGDGHHRNLFPEYLSRRCADFYITNGWRDSYYAGASIVPLPNVELSRVVKKNQKKTVRTEGLFVSTTGQPFLFRGDHWASVEGFEDYYDDQLTFFNHLERTIRNHLEYRPYPGNNRGWDIVGRMKQLFPEVLIVPDGSICHKLNTAKIIVLDHNITTLLMALAMNRPVVCYWQPFLYAMRPDCVAGFDQLRKVGVLYSNPESAARKVNTVWQTIDEWWQADEVQKVRNAFVSKYAKTAPDFAEQWRNMLQKILVSNSRKSA